MRALPISLCTCVVSIPAQWACAADVPIDYPARSTVFESAEADSSNMSPRTGPRLDTTGRPQPPPEAFSACKGCSEADACTVKFEDRLLEGTCQSFAAGATELICVPSQVPGR